MSVVLRPTFSPRAGKPRFLKKRFLGFRLFKSFSGFSFFRFPGFFLYEDRTRQYDPKAHEKHPIHCTPYLTKDKFPVSEGEHHVKKDEIDESHESQLKF